MGDPLSSYIIYRCNVKRRSHLIRLAADFGPIDRIVYVFILANGMRLAVSF